MEDIEESILMILISQEELKAILSEAKTNPNMQYITAGVLP